MKKLFFMAGVLLAGCRSEQVAFQFQPVAPATAVATPAPMQGTLATTAPAPTEPANVAVAPSHPAKTRRLAVLAKKLNSSVLPMAAALAPAEAPAARPASVRLLLLPRLALRHRATHGAAENGLGNIGLFFIAVVLGVLAGLAAIVNVIFSVGFFTALGYTAAGLVVLFLLYSLLSGGKKKKVKPAK